MDSNAENREKDRIKDQKQQDRDDLNNELAGRNVGRINRFVPEEQTRPKHRKERNDDVVIEAAMQLLTIEQQRQIAQLERQFERYDQAVNLALAEIDSDIARKEQELRAIQNNATMLSDGRRVYRDEQSGDFYDENDRKVSDFDVIEANQKYEEHHTTRQSFFDTNQQLNDLYQEREGIIVFQNKQTELKEKLDQNPEEAAAIMEELNDLPTPDRVQKHYNALSAAPSQEIGNRHTPQSYAREIDSEGGLQSDIALMSTFDRARQLEQVPATQEPDPATPKPDQEPMTLG